MSSWGDPGVLRTVGGGRTDEIRDPSSWDGIWSILASSTSRHMTQKPHPEGKARGPVWGARPTDVCLWGGRWEPCIVRTSKFGRAWSTAHDSHLNHRSRQPTPGQFKCLKSPRMLLGVWTLSAPARSSSFVFAYCSHKQRLGHRSTPHSTEVSLAG